MISVDEQELDALELKLRTLEKCGDMMVKTRQAMLEAANSIRHLSCMVAEDSNNEGLYGNKRIEVRTYRAADLIKNSSKK